LKQNKEIIYPRNEERYKFTERLRKWALKAVVPANLSDFEEKVGLPNHYLFLSNSLFLFSASETTAFRRLEAKVTISMPGPQHH